MRKVLLAVATAVLGSAILAGGSALADDDDRRYNRYKKRGDVLATGFMLCPRNSVAVFPATKVSKGRVRVKVSCVDSAGREFRDADGNEGPHKVTLKNGEPFTLTESCGTTDDTLVRCTIAGRKKHIERVRGVLHIIGETGFEVTEAINVSSGDDD